MSHSYNWCNLFWKITLRFLEITKVSIYKIYFSFSGNFPFKNIFYNCPCPCMGGCRILIILLSLQRPICSPFFPHQVSDWAGPDNLKVTIMGQSGLWNGYTILTIDAGWNNFQFHIALPHWFPIPINFRITIRSSNC